MKQLSAAALIFLTAVSCSPAGPPPTPATSSVAPSNKATPESNHEAVDQFVKLGLIKRMDLKAGKIYIDGALWEEVAFDTREGMVRIIAEHRRAEQGFPQVILYDVRSGKEWADYGAFTGTAIQ